ncbi:DUF3298 and DUF4163 domain-containing protein [Aquimarina sp. 2201CG5-10]|uniref:DUF3298 and DUF4163 domain-containing protein n=1 Tax=Aquimarina callyspongiae TaxID=3098150 RepID=UPI002AB3A415|nr:DUF4163 domain-containing protein [Aquimarina sp. 2201CG5-10]MDY8137111.1 DUF4163 domain-containing protein [Aquimarina sp. 2201CG5-10]
MINTKPNTLLIRILFMGLFISLYNCNTEESLTFEKQNITVSEILDCKKNNCALLEINLLHTIDNTQVSNRINQEVENTVCAILNIGEKGPAKSIEQAITQFNNSYVEMSRQFPEEIVPYEASINCDLSFQNKSLISIIMDSYTFTGGAHGSGGVSFININPKNGKRIVTKNLFKDHLEFKKYAEKIFRKEQNISEEKSINSTGFFFENDLFTLPDNIGFTDIHVILYYNQYEISSFADGPVELKIRKEEVASLFALTIL